MNRSGLSWVLGVALLVPVVVRAAEVEVREFVTTLDGQRVGTYRMTIAKQDDGSVLMSGQAAMTMNFQGVAAKYAYRGSEVWKNGRLQRLDSTSSDDHRKTTVSAAAEGDGVRVMVGGRERIVPGMVWATTYWQLPSGTARSLTLLDADNGRDSQGKLEPVGVSQIVVGGQPVSCSRYRLTGGAQVDLWYDALQRLVRQEWNQDGRKVVLELTQVRGQ